MAIAFLNNITFSGGAQSEKLRLENAGTNPSNPNEGQLYFNTSDNVVKVYANGAWVEVGGGVESLTAGTYLTNAGTATAVILNHDNTTRSDTTSTSSPGYGGTINVVNTVTTNATGHVTAVDIETVTFPSAESYTWTLTGDSGSNQTVNSGNTVDIAGGTNITTVVGNTDTVTVNLDDSVTLAGTLTVSGTGQSSFAGQVTIPATPVATTDAASKSYVDGLVSGGLTFKGTFRADTGQIVSGVNNGSFIYQLTGSAFNPSAARVAVAVGDYYVVATAAGNFYGDSGTGTCSTTQNLDIGDSVIGVTVANANASTCVNWSIVQSDEGVTDISASTVNDKLGINLSASTGSVAVGLDIDSLGAVPATSPIKLTVTTAGTGYSENDTYVTSTSGSGSGLTIKVEEVTGSSGIDTFSIVQAGSGYAVNDTVTLTGGGSGGNGVLTINNIGVNFSSTSTIPIYDASGDINRKISLANFVNSDGPIQGKRISLTDVTSGITRTNAGGITTYAVNVITLLNATNSFDVTAEVVATTGGATVYPEVTRETTGTISFKFTDSGNSLANNVYQVLLTTVS